MATPISIRNMVKLFGRGPAAIRAVDDVSLEIDPGELFFLLGPSGCGKTTLLRIVAGFERPTSGTVHFAGRDVTDLPANKRNAGMVFQSYALWPHLTVGANVAFGLDVRKVRGNERKERVIEALKAVRMERLAGRKPNQLSGGQQQRVALARAIVIRPDVLLLDEPLSNLDAQLRHELRSEIRRVCKQFEITTIYVTHDQKEALSMADRIGLLNAGKVEQTGPPGDLYRHPRSRFAAGFLGESNFLEGRVLDGGSGGARVQTLVGNLIAIDVGSDREDVVLSIRPEAFRILDRGSEDAANAMTCDHVSTTYLGDVAHHIVRHPSGQVLSVAEFNPARAAQPVGGQYNLSVDPSQVIVLER